MSLDSIVNVQITRLTESITQTGFGTLMLLGTHKRYNNRIRFYRNMAGVAEDFRPYDKEYIAAQDVFAQSPSPALLAIGRRTANTASVRVITSMSDKEYTVLINDIPTTIESDPTVEQSNVTLDAPLVASNLIDVVLNGEQLGPVKSIVTFSVNFTAGDNISMVINGVNHANVAAFTVDQATTMTALGNNAVALAVGISSFSVISTNVIRFNFSGTGPNTIDSVTTIGGSAPTATIQEGAFLFATSNADTMGVIAQAIQDKLNDGAVPPLAVVTVGGDNDEIISIQANPNQAGVVDSFTVMRGASQAVATIVENLQPVSSITIANALTTSINAALLGVTADDTSGDGTFTISADVPGVPFTLNVASNIVNPNQAVVQVTQIEPNQDYTVSINKIPFTYTAPIDVESAEEIAGALITLINANLSLPVTADFDSVAEESLVEMDANFVLNNVITISLNGAMLAPVAWAGSQLSTMQAIATLLQQQPGIQSATIFGSNNRNLQLRGLPDNDAVIDSFIVTLGVSQAVASITDTPQASGSIILTQDSGLPFNLSVTPNVLTQQKGLLVDPLDPSDAIEDDLDAVVDSNNDWYGVAITSRAVQDILSTATWVEARVKLFGTASSQLTIVDESSNDDETSLAYLMYTAGYTRSFLMFHQDADDDFPECAWFGRCLPLEPGSETWKFKRLNSISYTKLTATQSLNAQTKSVNTYQYVAGVGITAEGVVSSGEFIDIIRGIDWLTARIQEFVFSVLVNNNKVPYTDTGIAMIEAEVRRALDLGVTNNFLASDPEYIVTVPRASTVPSIDKANRILKNVNFQATLAGAIHFVEIRGTVTV